MLVYQIDYKIKKGKHRPFNDILFGRISANREYTSTKCYYIPGILDRIPYQKVFSGRIFLPSIEGIDFDPVLPYCDSFDISTASKEDKYIFLQTGRDKWMFKLSERGAKIANYR